jgi:hypothetical protein
MSSRNSGTNGGWIEIVVEGTVDERGFQIGKQTGKHLDEIFNTLEFTVMENTGRKLDDVIEITATLYGEKIREYHNGKYYKEMEAILRGILSIDGLSRKFTMNDVIFYNCYYSLDYILPHFPEYIQANVGGLREKYGEDWPLGNGGGGGGAEGGGMVKKDIGKNGTGGIVGGCDSSASNTTTANSNIANGVWGGGRIPLPPSTGGLGGTVPPMGDKCTGFMYTGSDYTKTGGIVCGHNTFDNFVDGQNCHYIFKHILGNGKSITFQANPCTISSGTDVMMSNSHDSNFIILETTFGGFIPFELDIPICCRSRHAVEMMTCLDEFSQIMKIGNGGDYASSWLVGDVTTGEIMQLELGLKYTNQTKTKNGYFLGFNAPHSPQIRNLECSNSGYNDIRRHQGARNVRLNQLTQKYKGEIDAGIGKLILGDHYDVYLKQGDNPCARTCCSHYNLDDRKYIADGGRPLPFQPRGAVDGIVMTSEMAKRETMLCKFGSSCEIPFIVKDYCKLNIQWNHLEPYLNDRPAMAWTEIGGKSDPMDVVEDVGAAEDGDDMEVDQIDTPTASEKENGEMGGGKRAMMVADKIRLKNRNTRKRRLMSRKRKTSGINTTQKRR